MLQKIDTAALEGADLDLIVAVAEGLTFPAIHEADTGPVVVYLHKDGPEDDGQWRVFAPSEDPVAAMKLLDDHEFSLAPSYRDSEANEWVASRIFRGSGLVAYGRTPMLAITRLRAEIHLALEADCDGDSCDR